MPYYQQFWNLVLGNGAPKHSHKLRTIPLVDSVDLMAQGMTAEQALSKPRIEPPRPIQINAQTVLNFRYMLTEKVPLLFFATQLFLLNI